MLRLVMVGILILTLTGFSLITIAQEQQPEATASIKKANGVETVEFDTLTGRVEVNLPDDLSDTDTISGTVVVEPKGDTKEEIEQNESTLSGYVIEVAKTQEVIEPPAEKPSQAAPPPTISKEPPTINVVPKQKPGFTCKIPPKSGTIVIKIIAGGNTICQKPVTCNAKPPATPPCVLPTNAIGGKPLRIPGGCDGRSSTTQIKVGGQTCPMIAEGPRQQICMTPISCTGRVSIVRTEGKTVTKGIINVKPPSVAAAVPASPKKPASSTVRFQRTGPVVTTREQSFEAAKEGYQVSVNGNQINFVGPISVNVNGHVTKKLVPTTVTFTPPPEQISPGDNITLTASVTGDEEYVNVPYEGPRGSFMGDGMWINVQGALPSFNFNTSHGESRSINCTLAVGDYPLKAKAAIEKMRSQNPAQAEAALKQLEGKPPRVTLNAFSGMGVKLEWVYVPIK